MLTILALIKAGLAYVPIAPNWPDGRIKMLLDDCQPIWAITNIKADPLYNATSSLEKENKPFPRIFQVCKYFFQHLYITKEFIVTPIAIALMIYYSFYMTIFAKPIIANL